MDIEISKEPSGYFVWVDDNIICKVSTHQDATIVKNLISSLIIARKYVATEIAILEENHGDKEAEREKLDIEIIDSALKTAGIEI